MRDEPRASGEHAKRAHLQVLRALAWRMRFGSIVVRIWALAIVGALVAITANPEHVRFGWLALFMALTFWLGDAYLVRQRRLFSRAHARAELQPDSELDLRLDTSRVDGDAEAWGSALLSRVPLAYYAGLILSLSIAWAILSCRG